MVDCLTTDSNLIAFDRVVGDDVATFLNNAPIREVAFDSAVKTNQTPLRIFLHLNSNYHESF